MALRTPASTRSSSHCLRGDARRESLGPPVVPASLPFLYRLNFAGESGYPWRQRGSSFGPEEFAENLNAGILVHFVVGDLATKTPLGYIAAYDADLRSGHCELLISMVQQAWLSGHVIDASLTFLN